MFLQYLCLQHFFFFPGPPYFFMSRQLSQDLQSGAVQPEQVPQRLRLVPTCKDKIID